jgi:hypothetical protein
MNEVGAVFVTGAIASLIAIWGVLSQRAITRRQVTLDHISHLESDRDIIEARKRFVELAKEPGGLARWAEADQEQTAEALAIGRILNSYELISIGIQRGIIDYELFKRWHRASAIKYWERGAPFVMRIRERLGNDMFFHEFEEMVGWFKGQTKPPKRRPGTFF